ncbi:Histone deacetylase family protein [Brugia malayi]|uniref:histone deacetylase n=1 Tax=Brugia malayi TaxID=6279 RepID=A0A4E9EVB1_BRUMA|nr:Histone deacetylase family protein [Brugia malayi]VIO88198.1 Histone deacetylase family protein [Brugia malayi]
MENQQQSYTTATVEGPSTAPFGIASDAIDEERLAVLQQIYQQKQVELLSQYQQAQTNLAMQHFTYFQALQTSQQQKQQQQQQQQQQKQSLHDTKTSEQTSSISTLDISEDSDTQVSPSTKDCAGLRNKRSYSGSGQTISQLTKERLKTMITSKMNRIRSESSNVSQATTTVWTTSAASSTTNSENIYHHTASWSSCMEGQSSQQMHTASSVQTPIALSSLHFEPYYIPSTMHAVHGTLQPSDYQLRKVSSEPNLKMRIRAKLLNKSAGPLQSQSSAFAFTQRTSQSGDAPMDTDLGGSTSSADSPTTLLAASPHLIIPSPSLPNLTSPAQIPMDMSALLAQALYSPFFSMPSLIASNPLQPSFSMVDSGLNSNNTLSEGASRNLMKFDTRNQNTLLSLGGYPSLLKQQLRDLVLRRKSLVREEPEDDAALEAQLLSRLQSGSVLSTQLKTGLVYDPAMARHQCFCGNNRNHVEHGERVQSIWSRLQERGLVEKCERVFARKAPLEMLRTVHAATYVTFFAVSPTACLKMEPSQLPVKSFVQLSCGGIGVDSDTYFNDASTQLAARIAVGSLAELALQVAESRLRNGFACIRPPGHHAEYNQAMGFCFLNNVAITVKYLQQRCAEQCSRIAIIDWDVHHGNGTQICFEADPSVLYLSLHRHDNGNFFPGTGAVTEVGVGSGKGYTVNIPFSGEMMDDADYLAAWRVIVAPILNQFKPTFIIVSAGFDAACGHPQALGGYNLSPQLFGYFTLQLMNYAGGRVVLALEGGYDLDTISDSAEECVKALCGESPETAGKLSDEALNAFPKQSAQETIQKVIAIHKKYWPSLTAAQGISSSELQWQAVAQKFASLSV